MSSIKLAKAAGAGLGARAVHIKINPRTNNIYESRHVLKFLKTFGAVDSFRNVQYDKRDMIAPHLIIAIFQDKEAADKLIAASPLRFKIPPRVPTGSAHPPSVAGIASIMEEATAGLNDKSINPIEALLESSDLTPDEPKEFEMTVRNLREYSHTAAIQRQASYWSYDVAPVTLPQKILDRRVPLPGLEYVTTDMPSVPQRVVNSKIKEIASLPSLTERYTQYLKDPSTASNDGWPNREHISRRRREKSRAHQMSTVNPTDLNEP